MAGLSKSLTPMRSMRDGEMHAAEKPHVANVAIEKVVTSEEHAEDELARCAQPCAG